MKYGILKNLQEREAIPDLSYDGIMKRFGEYNGSYISHKHTSFYSQYDGNCLLSKQESIKVFTELFKYDSPLVVKKLKIIANVTGSYNVFTNMSKYERAMKIAKLSEDEVNEIMINSFVDTRDYHMCYRIDEKNGPTDFQKEVIAYVVKNSYISVKHDIVVNHLGHHNCDKEEFDNILKAVELGLIKSYGTDRITKCMESKLECKRFVDKMVEINTFNNELNKLSKIFNNVCDDKYKVEILNSFFSTLKIYYGSDFFPSIVDVKEVAKYILQIPYSWFENSDIDTKIFGEIIGKLFKDEKTRKEIGNIFNPSNSLEITKISLTILRNRYSECSHYTRNLLLNVSDLENNKDYVLDRELAELVSYILSNLSFYDGSNNNKDVWKPKESGLVVTIADLLGVIKSIVNRRKADIKLMFEDTNNKLRESDWEYIYNVLIPYLANSFELFRNINKANPAVKMNDETFNISSCVGISDEKLKSYYYITDDEKVDLTSCFIVSRNDGSMLMYESGGKEFADKIEKVYSEQENPVIKCSTDILSKYPLSSNLVVKINGKNCILPSKGDVKVFGRNYIVELSDGTEVAVAIKNQELVDSNKDSEIMTDILKQIDENKGIVLRQL